MSHGKQVRNRSRARGSVYAGPTGKRLGLLSRDIHSSSIASGTQENEHPHKQRQGTILTLPYPPSVNQYWRNYSSRIVLSAAARKFKKYVAITCMMKNIQPLKGRVSVTMVLHPPDKRKRDIDNTTKATLDALQGYAYADDSQVDILLVQRGEVVKGGSVVVTVAAAGS